MDLLVQILLFFVLGLALFALDAWAGVGLYRAWYGMTHKDPLPAGEQRGFLVRRKASVRLAWALGIAGVIAIISVRYGSFFQDSTRVTLTLLAMLVGLGLGLLAAPRVLARLPGLLNEATDYVDAVESGERRPGEDLRKVAKVATAKVVEKTAERSPSPAKEALDPASPADAPDSGTVDPKPAAPLSDASEEPATTDSGREADPAKGSADAPGTGDWRKGVDDFLKK